MGDLRSLALGLALAAAPAPAAARVLVLYQPDVAQYADVAAGFGETRPEAPVNVADAAAVGAAFAKEPDVVVAIGAKALEAAQAHATGAAIVAAGVLAPAAGGRVTAVPLETRAGDVLAALAALAPRVRRISALHPPGAQLAVAEARAAARAVGVELVFHELADVSDFQASFRRATAGAEAVWLLADPRLARPEVVKYMVTTCLERRLPLVGFLDGMTRIGALLSVSPDFRAIGRETARLATELEGRRPEARRDVPPRFAPGKLSVNERVREMLALPGRAPAAAAVYR